MQLSSAQALGEIQLFNPGNAPAHPVWTIYGPGSDFKATSQSGETLHWEGELLEGELLVIDTKAGTVVDGDGENRYGDMAPAPRLWAVPPGTTKATVELQDAVAGKSKILCHWQPRAWMVV